MKKLLILTAFDEFFGQHKYRWISINVQILKSYLEEMGVKVEVKDYASMSSREFIPTGYNILYSGSQHLEYKAFIEDIILSIKDENKLLPPYEFLRAHENKGFQELFRVKLGLDCPESYYFGNLNDFKGDEIQFPAVFKTVEGAGSKGVVKVDSPEEVRKIVEKKGKWYWKYTKRKKDFHNTLRYKFQYMSKRFILQEFIPGLDSDYKVLVFGKHIYYVRRAVRENDFRASGSGVIEYPPANPALFDFAMEQFNRMDVPFASLDIVKCGAGHKLIEFQCLNFGPVTILNGNGYYKKKNDEWLFVEEEPDLEMSYARAVNEYLEKL